MNFFEHQDQARRKTGHLVVLFVLAVLLLIGMTQVLVMGVMAWLNGVPLQEWQLAMQYFSLPALLKVAAVIGLVVALASGYKLLQLSGGGKVVAEAMGGRLLNINSDDADERKLLNVVQEMAIASGSPVPPVYLMEEDGINAFAAGYKPSDAVIGVTRGCVQQLDRDELQGVIAHEFSHIFNGDMRLNIRLIGVLNGILVIGMIGYFILRSVSRTGYRSRSSKNNSALPFLALGAGLMAIGYAGTFFGNWIKAAVSRQREFLADSSAVQFTRNPAGISGALKKIGGFSAGSKIEHPQAGEMSHMFFGQAVKPFLSSMMATHPPLAERISRIDPSWNGRFDSASHTAPATASSSHQQSQASARASGGAVSGFASAASAVAATTASDELLNSIGGTDDKHVDYAHKLLDSLPAEVLDAASEPYGARALVYCLLLDNDESIREKQWQLLQENANSVVFSFTRQLHVSFRMVAEYRLPLLELSLPALKQLTAEQYEQFRKNVIALMQADARIDLHEWALYRVLLHHLQPSKTKLAELGSIRSLKLVGKACGLLLSAMAEAGVDKGEAGLEQAQESFSAATKTLGLKRLQFVRRDEYELADLSRALQVLCRLQPLQKPRLLKALCVCVTHDGEIKPVEIELIRAIALNLDCPMPPFILD